MLSFASSLGGDREAFAIFVNDKSYYRDKKNLLSKNTAQKINSFLSGLKEKKNNEEYIFSFDISEKQKCFVIKVKNKFESYLPQ